MLLYSERDYKSLIKKKKRKKEKEKGRGRGRMKLKLSFLTADRAWTLVRIREFPVSPLGK